MGTKRSVLVDEKGLPLAIVISGANTHDVKLLEETLDHIVVPRPEPDEKHPQNLCLDAGYTGGGEAVKQRDYIPHIRPRGEEKNELERKARRKILCKRNSTKSRMALEKQCRWRPESLGYPWPSVARRYARRRRECRRTSEGTLKQGVSRRHGRRT